MAVKGKQEARSRRLFAASDQHLHERFAFRNIRKEESGQAARIERICFPPNEACSMEMIVSRIERVPELFLVAEDRGTGNLAGFLSGLATDESAFRDDFFSDASLYDPNGTNIMLLGLDVLPDYRGQGLARELMYEYLRRECEKGTQCVRLTCLPAKIEMYKKMGFCDEGVSQSVWGGEQWHEMSCELNGPRKM
ncbi:MAG: GNAT family N-acetyltransferase [Eubacterium sp.]|jgi:ribosomal protein S18 acetylase RimI-like enzyme|nr:GNAT family N-acetyltransferase [Eubacterium sp.]